MGGLPSLTIDVDLATTWRKVLIENGLNVRQDDAKEGQSAETHVPKRVSETLWRVGNGSHDLKILEVQYNDRPDDNIYLVFMPPLKRGAEHQLFLLVRELLIASGATVGVSKKSAK
jgi:hypothetical protein